MWIILLGGKVFILLFFFYLFLFCEKKKCKNKCGVPNVKKLLHRCCLDVRIALTLFRENLFREMKTEFDLEK